MSGYLYRIPKADSTTLRATVATVVGFPCTSFGGAALWEFDPAAGRDNLRRLQTVASAEQIAVTGDFGHAFGRTAEVRWRRRNQEHYDILILTDTPGAPAGARPLGGVDVPWATSVPEGARLLLSDEYSGPVRYIAYHAPNGAVQFLSYREEQQ
ncbi:MAG: hypothetical protein OHK0015_40980 [Chloroflexi bacterium OHK40]